MLLGGGPGDLTPKQERYLQQVRDGGQRLLTLVNDLLEMAESQTGLADFRVDRLAVGDHVAEVLTPLAVAAGARQTDTGIGIRAEDLERIFRGFEQVDASDSRQYGCAGLGLALVRHLVGLHGGWVWAESDGEGHVAPASSSGCPCWPPRRRRGS